MLEYNVLHCRNLHSNSHKIESKQMFNPSSEYFASRDHMTNVVFAFLQDHRVQERYRSDFEQRIIIFTFIQNLVLYQILKHRIQC